MKKLISLFLFFLPLVGFAQIPDANINTDINYVRTHGFDPPSTALPMQDLQNSKIGTIVLQATGTDTYVVSTFNSNISAYLSGTTFPVYFQNGNTGAATLKLGTLATKTLVKNTSTALASADIASGGRLHWVYYDGTNFRISLGGTSGGLIAANNLSDVANAATSRTNLGLAIGTDVEAHDMDLTAIAGLSASNDDFIQRKAGAWSNRTIAQVKSDLGLTGTNSGDQTDATLSFTDITTNNASTSKHGFLKKLSNTATQYMDGTGNWSTPAGGGGGSPGGSSSEMQWNSGGSFAGEPTLRINTTTSTNHYLMQGRTTDILNTVIMEIKTADTGTIPTNYGSFWHTLSQGYTNPANGRNDAVWHWGWNQNGGGGRMNDHEAEIHWAIENIYDPGGGGGSYNFEVHLEATTSVDDGNKKNRIISIASNRATGVGGAFFTLDVFDFRRSNYTPDPLSSPFWPSYLTSNYHGQTEVTGDTPYFSIYSYSYASSTVTKQANFTITPLTDGSSVSITTTGAGTAAMNFSSKAGAGGINFNGGQFTHFMPVADGTFGITVNTQGAATSSGTLYPFQSSVSANLSLWQHYNTQTNKDALNEIHAAGTGRAGFRLFSGSTQQIWNYLSNNEIFWLNIPNGAAYAFGFKTANNRFWVGNNTSPLAQFHVFQDALSSSLVPTAIFTPGNLTGGSASTAYPDFVVAGSTKTVASGTVAIQAFSDFQANTWAGTSGTATATVLTSARFRLPVVGSNAAGDVSSAYFDGKLEFDNTITGSGTTGNQTINKPIGTVRVAASGTTVTVTNSFCTATSFVFAMVRTGDATAYVKNAVPSAGSFIINLGTAATAETEIQFWVLN